MQSSKRKEITQNPERDEEIQPELLDTLIKRREKEEHDKQKEKTHLIRDDDNDEMSDDNEEVPPETPSPGETLFGLLPDHEKKHLRKRIKNFLMI